MRAARVVNIANNNWTDEEFIKLETLYPSAFPQELTLLFPGHSKSAIVQMAHKMRTRHAARKIYYPVAYTNVADGSYVSGLVDGEGTFQVTIVKRDNRWNFNPKFAVGLRVDDSDILLWLMKYFGCGHYNEALNRPSPMGIFCIADLYSIMSRVLPHFDAFPLRAKKRHDFAVWREMTLLQAEYFRVPWTEQVRRKMLQLYNKLKKVRRLG